MGQVCGVGRGLRWKIKQNKSKFLALSMLGSKLFDIPSYHPGGQTAVNYFIPTSSMQTLLTMRKIAISGKSGIKYWWSAHFAGTYFHDMVFLFNCFIELKLLKIQTLSCVVSPQFWSTQTLKFSRGWSGGAMVLGKRPMPGRPTKLDYSRATALSVGAGCLDILSLSLWETARYRLKYCLKRQFSTKQPTIHQI